MMGKSWAVLLAGWLACSAGACAPIYHPDAYADGYDLDQVSDRGDGVLLLSSTRLRQPAEVIAILDVQLEHDGYESGLAQLAARATELGADAVVGVEFTHGGPTGPGHLSGLAVRVLR